MGKQIKIFMINGTLNGAKTIEIGNWSGKAIYSPRANLKNFLAREEFAKPGIYFLKSESSSLYFDENIYIGEAEKLQKRLKNHLFDKRDFESVVCFISKDEMLTKAHIKYLESRIISIAQEANTSEIENKQSPKLPTLSEADISDMEYFIEHIKLILPLLGIKVLISAIQHPVEDIKISDQKKFRIKSKDLDAEMVETRDGFIVLRNSKASESEVDSLYPSRKKLRKKLLDDGTLKKAENCFIFTKNTTFSSLSEAASVILGSQVSGPEYWIDENGKTYKELQKEIV